MVAVVVGDPSHEPADRIQEPNHDTRPLRRLSRRDAEFSKSGGDVE